MNEENKTPILVVVETENDADNVAIVPDRNQPMRIQTTDNEVDVVVEWKPWHGARPGVRCSTCAFNKTPSLCACVDCREQDGVFYYATNVEGKIEDKRRPPEQYYEEFMERLPKAATIDEVDELVDQAYEGIDARAHVDLFYKVSGAASRKRDEIRDEMMGKKKDEPAKEQMYRVTDPCYYEELEKFEKEKTKTKRAKKQTRPEPTDAETTRANQRRNEWEQALKELEKEARRADALEEEAKKHAREAKRYAQQIKRDILELVALGPENYQTATPLFEQLEKND